MGSSGILFDKGLRVLAQESTSPSAIGWNSTGTRFFMAGRSSQRIWQYDTTRPWDLNSIVGVAPTTYTPTGLTSSFVFGITDNNRVSNYYYYGPYTLTYYTGSNQLFPVGQQQSIAFKTDGQRMYLVGVSSISQVDLANPWNIANVGEIYSTGLAWTRKTRRGGRTRRQRAGRPPPWSI